MHAAGEAATAAGADSKIPPPLITLPKGIFLTGGLHAAVQAAEAVETEAAELPMALTEPVAPDGSEATAEATADC